MGHPEPFELQYVAIGNEDCGKVNYIGNYLKFYYAIKNSYPDIKIISNCDASSQPLDHPADLYDVHAFVSEYAVTGKDAGNGSLLAALGEAAFLIGLENNSDAVEMASYAPLFVNENDRRGSVNLSISVSGLQNAINASESKTTVLTSNNVMDENSFQEPNKLGTSTKGWGRLFEEATAGQLAELAGLCGASVGGRNGGRKGGAVGVALGWVLQGQEEAGSGRSTAVRQGRRASLVAVAGEGELEEEM
ncbi:uncharacterized protein A4U43_C08F32310 [Asparagus officinalis]|nr:uncharacterized protein A4U43_C08F32310 [Asparagus officinalis]